MPRRLGAHLPGVLRLSVEIGSLRTHRTAGDLAVLAMDDFAAGQISLTAASISACLVPAPLVGLHTGPVRPARMRPPKRHDPI